jgi:bacterioferritin-associated ferredoxin
MPVDRCVCHKVSFQVLRDIARREGCGLEQLAAKTGCTTGCGMCRPYVERMLQTGQTSFVPMPMPATPPRPRGL